MNYEELKEIAKRAIESGLITKVEPVEEVKPVVIRNCKQCNAEFVAVGKKTYCNKECAKAGHKIWQKEHDFLRRKNTGCVICGERLRTGKKTCSERCAERHRKAVLKKWITRFN